MKVMVIVKASKDSEAGIIPSQELMIAMGKYNEELVHAGIMETGEGLKASSSGIRIKFAGRNREVIDGPFAETKELVAGFWIWQVKSMEEALSWAKKAPMLDGDALEIRQIQSAEDFAEKDPTGEIRASEEKLRKELAEKKR